MLLRWQRGTLSAGGALCRAVNINSGGMKLSAGFCRVQPQSQTSTGVSTRLS